MDRIELSTKPWQGPILPLNYIRIKLVSGQGLEPRFCESKSHVLPLDDPEIVQTLYSIYASLSSTDWHPERESNPHSGFRRTMSSPLNDRGIKLTSCNLFARLLHTYPNLLQPHILVIHVLPSSIDTDVLR